MMASSPVHALVHSTHAYSSCKRQVAFASCAHVNENRQGGFRQIVFAWEIVVLPFTLIWALCVGSEDVLYKHTTGTRTHPVLGTGCTWFSEYERVRGLVCRPCMYMEKLAAGPALKGVVDLGNTVAENIHAAARALKKELREVRSGPGYQQQSQQ